jgi:4-phytase/acid phosphatase
MSAKRLFLILLLLVAPALSQMPQLRMVVVLTRHGVRSPLAASTVSPYASQPWPSLSDDWHVACAGNLTPRGRDLVEQMGIFYHAYYADKGLLPQVNQCPARQVYIWADNEERTRETASALADGMSQGVTGCLIPVNSLPYVAPMPCTANTPTDVFFHPLSDNVLKGRIKPAQVAAAAKKINEEVPQLRITYRPALQAMQDTLRCCDAAKVCKGSRPCTLSNLNDQAKASGTSLTWDGMFSVSSTAAENFLLEYGNGMTCDKIGWNRVTFENPDKSSGCDGGQSFRQMEELHTLYFDKMKHAGYMAQIQGSNLANQILQRLQQGGPAPFVIYSGHDTDVSSVAGLLHLNWSLPDLPDNDTPPAGALIFELWGGATPETQSVRLYYVHQTLTQLRKLEPLSLKNPPNMVELKLPCRAQPCPFTQFQTIMHGAILKDFTTTGPWGALVKQKSAKTK